MENTTENSTEKGLKVGVICGTAHVRADDPEIKLRQMLTKLMFMVNEQGGRELDINKFKHLTCLYYSESNINTEVHEDMNGCQIMEAFFSLSDTEQKVILNKSITAKKPSISPELINETFINTYEIGVERTESELKKLIKYSKNPMEKQALQRELSSINFCSGKHSKGNRRKRK